MSYFTETMGNLLHQTAFFNLTWGNFVMILVACIFLYLAIAKGFEPLLLVPIAFGMLLVNIYPDIFAAPEQSKIIALTSNKNSTLARHADYVLDITVEREVCPNNLAPTTSALVTLALGDALAVSLITARHFQPADFAKFHPGGSLGRRLLCKVKDQMQTRLPITTPDTSFTDCLTIMNEGRMGVALVMENQQLKGIITDGDVRRALTANGADTLNKTAKELMTSSPKTIHENEFLAKAEDLMKEKKIHSLVVVNDENNVVGLVEFSS